jgi:alginate O-acetyltransferase complex protein AlgI
MIYHALSYWALLGATAAVFALSAPDSVRTRSMALISASLVALALVVGVDRRYGLVLLLGVIWVTVSVRMAGGSRGGRLLFWIGPIALLWALTKIASAGHALPFLAVGFSYFFIKSWTLLKDVQDRRVSPPDPFVVVAYFLYFPTFISGPMHLFSEFDRSVRAPRFPDLEGVIDAVFRVLLGSVKLVVIAPLLVPVSLESAASAGSLPVSTLAAACVAYSFVLWANFSGYSDLAIATSRLAGVYTPENFNYPYAAPNIREFWQRWHMTFTRVLTSYIFVPLSRRLQPALGDRPRTLMMVCTLVTFLFCGFWHGAMPNFVAWGLYHACGLIVFDLYRTGAVRRRQRRKGHAHSALIAGAGRLCGTALTFAFVSVGWILFVFPLSTLLGK